MKLHPLFHMLRAEEYGKLTVFITVEIAVWF